MDSCIVASQVVLSLRNIIKPDASFNNRRGLCDDKYSSQVQEAKNVRGVFAQRGASSVS